MSHSTRQSASLGDLTICCLAKGGPVMRLDVGSFLLQWPGVVSPSPYPVRKQTSQETVTKQPGVLRVSGRKLVWDCPCGAFLLKAEDADGEAWHDLAWQGFSCSCLACDRKWTLIGRLGSETLSDLEVVLCLPYASPSRRLLTSTLQALWGDCSATRRERSRAKTRSSWTRLVVRSTSRHCVS